MKAQIHLCLKSLCLMGFNCILLKSLNLNLSSAFVGKFPITRCTLKVSKILPTRQRHSKIIVNRMSSISDQNKWERMYFGEETNRKFSDNANSLSKSEIKVVTFDLDDTIWRTGKVIGAANQALEEYLDKMKIEQPRQVKDVMKELYMKNKTRYCPEFATNSKIKPEPVLLTMLRKDAIEDICLQDNGYSAFDAQKLAEESFQVWTKARHDAIPSNLADSVVECLEKIRSLQTSSGFPVVIGAITNGNSDPRRVPLLETYFDFCINSEDVGKAKPSSEIYKKAVETVSNHPATADLFSHMKIHDSLDNFMDYLGPWWVHCGDDFLKDVVAAKELGMRTIWARELVLRPGEFREESPTRSNRTTADLMRDLSKQDIIRMEIGSQDYLQDSITNEFADITVNKFLRISEVISEWHLEDVPQEFSSEGIDLNLSSTELPEYFEVTYPDSSNDVDSNSADSPKENSKEMKFCIFCGEKLPKVAKFCSSCGAAQE